MEDTDSNSHPLVGREQTRSSKMSGRGHEVYLNVYDYNWATSYLNMALRQYNLGMHHCGLEVLGEELFFAGAADTIATGVHLMPEPRKHPTHVFQTAICLGETP